MYGLCILILRGIKNGNTKFFGFYTILDLATFCAYYCLLDPPRGPSPRPHHVGPAGVVNPTDSPKKRAN